MGNYQSEADAKHYLPSDPSSAPCGRGECCEEPIPDRDQGRSKQHERRIVTNGRDDEARADSGNRDAYN